MGKFAVCNALSLNMMTAATKLMCVPVTINQAKKAIAQRIDDGQEIMSAIGHADTARVVGDMLGIDLPANRTTLTLDAGDLGTDSILVAQYKGPRLPEGATSLPEEQQSNSG